MKKMNYPKVIFRPYINENKEWKILPYVTLPDIYKFDKKVYKQLIKEDVYCSFINDEVTVEFYDIVKVMRKLHKVSDKFLEFTRYINDYKRDTNKRAELFIFVICKAIKEKGNDIRKDIVMLNEKLNNDNDIVLRQVNDYVEYLADRCIIQEESLIKPYPQRFLKARGMKMNLEYRRESRKALSRKWREEEEKS